MPTAQIIYSVRFVDHPEIARTAAQRGKLPFFKPYGERYSIPSLDSIDEVKDEQKEAAFQALHAAVSFVDHLLTASSPRERRLKAANRGLENAMASKRKWELLSQVFVAAGLGLLFFGVLATFFLGVGEGVVTSASGVVIALISKLLFPQLAAATQLVWDERQAIERASGDDR